MYGIIATLRSSLRYTASFFESGDHRIWGRRGCGRTRSLGRGIVTPYDQYSTPSVVSCVESHPAARPPAVGGFTAHGSFGRTKTLCFAMNASVRLSGDTTNGTSLGSESPTVHRYAAMSQTNRLRFAVNSISRSFRPSF